MLSINNMSLKKIIISLEEEETIKEQLEKRSDPEAQRLERFLAMPDLTRAEGNPLCEIAKRVLSLEDFKDFYDIKTP